AEEYMRGTDDERYSSATIGFDFSQNLTEALELTIKASSDRDLDNADNWTIDSEAALKSKLTERISLIISAADRYDNDPPPGVKENDFTLMTALGLAF
ncbi:DUF481 domain-containing protein, partial [Planctomycetota bacterium]